MADRFYLDEDEFELFTKDLRLIGKNFDKAQGELSDTLRRYVGAWGNDEIGKAFEKNYWENAEKVREGVEEGGDGIIETAREARKFARKLGSVDEKTARRLDRQNAD